MFGEWQETPVETVQTLFPLLLTNIPEELVESIVTTQLTNQSRFWLDFPVPSVSAAMPQFEPQFTVDLMWRGPTWPILNWFTMQGLTKHGYNDVAHQLMDRWINLYQKAGVYEMYNPLNGTAAGVEGLGMSTLIVDWLYRLGIVN